jgi:hypothetical protein
MQQPTLESVIEKLPPGYTVLIHRTPDGVWFKAMFYPDMEFKPWEGGWAQPGTNQAAALLDSALDMELEMIAYKAQQEPRP